MDIARNLGSFSGREDACRGWVFTIERRRVSDHRRAAKRRPAAATDERALHRLAAVDMARRLRADHLARID